MKFLFNADFTINAPITLSSKWPYVKDGLEKNLRKVIGYYQNHTTAVREQHLLVRLIQSFAVPFSLDSYRYMANIEDAMFAVASSLRLTSSRDKGKIFKGVFYGEKSREIIIASDESFDPMVAEANWKKLTPIKVLRHDHTDLVMNIPDGQDYYSDLSTAVIAINIPMLCLMYRCFKLEERAKALRFNGSERSVLHFVRMYALPSMLKSHLDQVLINRLLYLSNHLTPTTVESGHSFYLIDYSQQLNEVQKNLIEHLKDSKKNFYLTMNSIPLITKPSMLEFSRIPDLIVNNMCDWAYIIARLPNVRLLCELSNNNGKSRNNTDMDKLRRLVKMINSNQVLRNQLPIELYTEVMVELSQLDLII